MTEPCGHCGQILDACPDDVRALPEQRWGGICPACGGYNLIGVALRMVDQAMLRAWILRNEHDQGHPAGAMGAWCPYCRDDAEATGQPLPSPDPKWDRFTRRARP